MPIHLGWQDVVLRLTLTAIAGTLIGLDRGAHDRPAGLRTTLLVCLASAIAMIQTNLMLLTVGKPADSFVTLDLMRLPLGILTGMGFIGGGAILKRGDIVLGVTTAATLWFVTVIGLCFGGGQLALGVGGLVIGIIVLRGFKRLEDWLPHERRARLTITGTMQGTTEDEIRAEILHHGFQVTSSGVRYDKNGGKWTLRCDLEWRSHPTDSPVPPLVKEFSQRPGVSELDWSPLGRPSGDTR